MIKSQITNSAKETQVFSAKFAGKILRKKPGKSAVVLGLHGDLGAGKTTFLQGFAKGLGIKKVINSPTFVIMKRFTLRGALFKNFYHFDCYRLENAEDILSLGFKDIIKNPENIVAIEWPEKIKKLLPEEVISIQFDHLEESKRKISIDS